MYENNQEQKKQFDSNLSSQIDEKGLRIKEIRQILQLSQKEFAERIGISRSALANIEVGRRKPKSNIIKSICRIFNISHLFIENGTLPMLCIGDGNAAILEELKLRYHLTDIDIKIIQIYISLDSNSKDTFYRFAKRIADIKNE